MNALQGKAQRLLSLHTGGRLLILPNVWDPIGARVLEASGYPAVATASAAVSASLGYQDGERIRRSTLMAVLERIARSVDVPVTADIEAGYGKTIPELEQTVQSVIESGIAGVNIEDGLKEGDSLRGVPDQCERIAAVRQAAASLGVHLVINARVDSFIAGGFGTVEEAVDDAATRATAYVKAGADCVYPIGPGDEETVRALRSRIAAPINILGRPGAAPLSALESIGINRVSFGPFVFRSCLRTFLDVTDALIRRGDYSGMTTMLSSAEAVKYLREGPE